MINWWQRSLSNYRLMTMVVGVLLLGIIGVARIAHTLRWRLVLVIVCVAVILGLLRIAAKGGAA